MTIVLSEETLLILNNARQEARQGHFTEVLPEHTLLSLLQNPENSAVKILQSMNIPVDAIRQAAGDSLKSFAPLPSQTDEHAEPPNSADLEDILQDAIAEAANNQLTSVDSAMLFLSMILNPLLNVSGILRMHGVRLADFQGRARTTWRARSNLAETPPSQKPLSMPARKVTVQEYPTEPGKLPYTISPVFISILVVTLAAGALTYLNAIPAGLGVFLFVTAGWLVSLCLHEFSHAAAAYLSGDESVVNHGYLTLNPFRYTRLFLSIILPLLFLMSGGIGLPGGAVYINMAAIRKPRLRSLVSAAGPLANLSFAILLSVLYLVLTRLSNFTDHIEFFAGLTLLIFLQLTALVLNLIPLPGLDGFGILAPYLPDSLLRIAYLFGQFSILILIIIFFYNNPVRQVFWDSIGLAMRIANLDPALVITGLDLFRFWTG